MTRRRYQYPQIASSEITPESMYIKRRSLMALMAGSLAGAALSTHTDMAVAAETGGGALNFAPVAKASRGFFTNETLTPFDDVTSYNNFYEFGMDKGDPKEHAHAMSTDPWSVKVGGLVNKPGKLNLEDIMSSFDLEERIYRLRCVEAWSMVVPWVGFPLADLLKRFDPKSEGKFVEFKTAYRRGEMRGTRSFSSSIDWPYREGLRMDEAMHPMTLMAVGLYGKSLPNQNGAPLRLVVPWKYGFKSIKSVVEINVVDKQPETSWQSLAPQEYGFYSNVNPQVDHPRWSQHFERRLPSSLFKPNRIETRLFNGYAEQVAPLYAEMDLARDY